MDRRESMKMTTLEPSEKSFTCTAELCMTDEASHDLLCAIEKWSNLEGRE